MAERLRRCALPVGERAEVSVDYLSDGTVDLTVDTGDGAATVHLSERDRYVLSKIVVPLPRVLVS